MSSEKYYVLSENFCLDSNQWSILIGAIGVLLTLFGFIIAFVIYQKQRNDNAQDAFNYFQSSLPELKKAIEGTIESLKIYAGKLKDENDDFGNPMLTSSLNDNWVDGRSYIEPLVFDYQSFTLIYNPLWVSNHFLFYDWLTNFRHKYFSFIYKDFLNFFDVFDFIILCSKWIFVCYFCEMNKYNRYHSTIKTSYALGIENQVLPDSFTQSIPRSTSQSWKELPPEKFVGNEFASQVENDLEKVKLILDEKLKKITTAFYAFCRLYLTILEFIEKKNFEKIILQNRESVIDLISNLPVGFNSDLVCKFLQITPHQFNIWKHNRLYKCALSVIGYCSKRFPHQISQKEINTLKSLMSRKRFQSWSLASVWGYAVKKNHISMSRTSWYRYCLRLGVTAKRKIRRKECKKGSVKASRPNEIWHADVTEFTTSDNVKFYVHSVLDNFSRKIIAYTVSRDKSAKTRLISLKEAILLQFSHILSPKELDLIVDGGSENNNFRIRNFIRHCQVKIHKKIALKDVRFSNSMIEGHFKTLKKFLRSQGDIHSNEFHKVIEFFVKDYNSVRPHYQHQIYTPNEIHLNPELSNIKPTLERINKERLQNNRTSCCKVT